jgi:diphthine synthase
MLYVIGLGLSDEKDITVKGLEVSLSPRSFPFDLPPSLVLTSLFRPPSLCSLLVAHDSQAVKKSTRVYLEAYTSILMIPKEKLEEFYGREIILATRETVELEADSILQNAQTEDVSFLVVGDPTAATTHTDLLLRAATKGIRCEVIHNASIMTALGSTGLQLYNFGQTLSLCFYTDNWKPGSWYDRLEENLRLGMHTCVLLDIKVREQSEEDMIR